MKNEMKTILFGTLIMAMILPFSGMNYAVAEEQTKPKFTKRALDLTEFYVTINDIGIASFDAKQAKEDGLSKKIVHSVKIFYKEQNKMMRGESVDLSQFEDLISELQNDTTPKPTWWCNPYGQTSRPVTVIESTYQSNLESSKEYMKKIGYHNVAEYALHPNATPDQASRDFQKNVGAHSCSENSGIYRAEAYLRYDTSYEFTAPEPNPEMLSYVWPNHYWPVYVATWHYLF